MQIAEAEPQRALDQPGHLSRHVAGSSAGMAK